MAGFIHINSEDDEQFTAWAPSEDERQTIQQLFNEGGAPACADYYKSEMEKWKTVKINMAVIGACGAGKSSFINAIRQIGPYDEFGAPVGVTETTFECRPYRHPNNDQLLFWDIPGLGTSNFPKETYLNDINVDQYDCFLILSHTRFTENDAWLGKELAARNKSFYFVRTKIGDDIRNDKYDRRLRHNPVAVMDSVRNDIKKQLNEKGLTVPVFLIDNHKIQKYEFDDLQHQIITDLPNRQREAMILTLTVLSHTLIKEKIKEMNSRAWKAAFLSATAAVVPVPGLSIAVDSAILSEEFLFYKRQLGLDEDSLRRRAEVMNVDPQTLFDLAEEFHNAKVATVIRSFLLSGIVFVGAAGVEECVRLIPIIGALVAAPISFFATRYALTQLLDKMGSVSMKVIDSCWASPVDEEESGSDQSLVYGRD